MPHRLFSRFSGAALRGAALCACSLLLAPAAQAAPGDLVTVVYVNGIATTASQAVADRNALSATLQGSALRPAYPESISVENEYNPTAGSDVDTAELVALKVNEERYLGRIWRALLEGNDAPEVLDAADLAAVYDEHLPLDPASIQTVVQRIVSRWTSLLADPRRKLVLVGHSQGNFIVNWAWLGLQKNLGVAALERVRVVNLASSTAWSPFGLDVTLAEDAGVFSFLAGKGLTAPRDTPFCRTAGGAEGCPFRTASATVSSGAICTTELAQAAARAATASPSCHNFRSTYLSDLATTTVATRRFALAAFEREGGHMAQRLVDAVFTALDAMNRATPAGWQDNLFNAHFGHNASSPAPGSITLGSTAAPRSAAVGKATFGQGLQASWRGCMDATPNGESWAMLDMQRRDGALSAAPDQPGAPLWALGFQTRAANPNTLYVLFGRSAAPTADQGSQRLSARPARQGGAFCGRWELAIGSDGFGSARFVNDKGGASFGFRSARPITEGVKRLHLSTVGASPLSVQQLSVAPLAFEPPFPQEAVAPLNSVAAQQPPDPAPAFARASTPAR